MLTLSKNKERNLIILNLTDIQLGNDEWNEAHLSYRIILHTVETLMQKVKPDLIVLSGDQSWCGHYDAYQALGELFERYKVPWTLVWGNHDQDKGMDKLDQTIALHRRFPHFLYENGPEELGRGNFVLMIQEDERPVGALILMDSHNCKPFVTETGEVKEEWAEISAEQIAWYRKQIEALQAIGCGETILVMHIPLYTYRLASDAAFKKGIHKKSIRFAESLTEAPWNEGYEDAFGVEYEVICSYPADNGFFDVISELGSTKHIIVGHDHTNCTSIPYRGVRLTYALKTGRGCYWTPELNGGTVLTLSSKGVTDIHHEFVGVMHLVEE